MQEQSKPVLTLDTFLKNSGRKVKIILGDNNCFFRTLSHQLFNTEEKHYTMRSTVVRFENVNKAIFSNYLMANNEPTITEHIKKMDKLGTWATQVEVIATSSLFQIPLYYLRRFSDNLHWEVIKPISPDRLHFPLLVDSLEDFPQPTNNLTHFELLYTENTHYDSLVDTDTGVPCRSMPVLAPKLIATEGMSV